MIALADIAVELEEQRRSSLPTLFPPAATLGDYAVRTERSVLMRVKGDVLLVA
jgi:hypothetical protein